MRADANDIAVGIEFRRRGREAQVGLCPFETPFANGGVGRRLYAAIAVWGSLAASK